MSDKPKIQDVYDDFLFVIIGALIFYLSFLGFGLWNDKKDQYYANNPDAVEGAFTFISLFLVIPLFTFAAYLVLQGMNGIVEYSWNARKGEEEVSLHH